MATLKQRPQPIGRMLLMYRTASGLNVRDHAAEIGISPATLSRVERGHSPDLATWRRLETWMLAASTQAKED